MTRYMPGAVDDLGHFTPGIVLRHRHRYRQVAIPVHTCGAPYREPDHRPIWHLDGVAWDEAKLPRWWHVHRAQTVVRVHGEVWRCRCGAWGGPGRRWRKPTPTEGERL